MKTPIKLTSRDEALIAFLKQGFIGDADLLSTLFFNSKKACQRRVQQLYQSEQIKRTRRHQQEPYIYYYQRFPSDAQHALLKSRLVAKFKTSTLQVVETHVNVSFGRFKTDLVFVVRDNQQTTHLILADVSAYRSFNDDKYVRVSKSNSTHFQEQLSAFQPFDRLCILACCPRVAKRTIANFYHLSSVELEEDFSNFITFLTQSTAFS